MSRAGRPKQTDELELITLDEALSRAQEYLKTPGPPYTRRTLTRKINAGEFTRYGTFKHILIDWAEFRRSLNWRKPKRVG